MISALNTYKMGKMLREACDQEKAQIRRKTNPEAYSKQREQKKKRKEKKMCLEKHTLMFSMKGRTQKDEKITYK